MIIILPETMEELYIDINRMGFLKTQDSIYYRGYQKILTEISASVEYFGKFTFKLTDIGYTNLKMKSLTKYYYDAERCKKFLAQVMKAKKAKAASLYFPTIGEDKGGHKKDHCIRGIGVNVIKGNIVNIHIFYRSSELSKKFFADLVFFNEVLWHKLELPRDVPIHFHFVGAYVHSKQFPIYLLFDRDILNISWSDDYMYKMVLKNLKNLSIGKCSNYGMIKSTDKFFLSQMSSEELGELI